MFDLIGKRYYFFGLSFILILCGIVGYIVHGGFNLDIQFKGGTVINIEMTDDKFDTNKIENDVTKEMNRRVTAQKSEVPGMNGAKSTYMLKLSIADALETKDTSKIIKFVDNGFNVKKDATPEIDSISASIGKELRDNALKAAFFACILIILYIWWRFKIMAGLSAGITGILALLHDILIMLSVYTVFNIPLNESFIAAILTVLGYSMNDTIIIYDRIRENSHLLKRVPIAELVNKSVIQTLNRSINTVLTVLISLITIYAFAQYYGIVSVKEFTFPLIIGIASGCYSSIFVASPLWVMWKEHKAKGITGAKPAKA